MKFFGVHIQDLESEAFLSASNDQITTWLFLHALCSKERNGGRVTGARALGTRFWSRHGIEEAILLAKSPLWFWEGSDLVIEPYDIEGQRVYERKKAGGKLGAENRWRSKQASPDGSPNENPKASPDGSPNAPNPTQPDLTLSLSSEPSSRSANDSIVIEIYNAYPKKVAKAAALKAIKTALKKVAAPFLLERVSAYATAIQWQDRQYIPHPASWFNGERFNDDPDSWKDSKMIPAASVTNGFTPLFPGHRPD